LRLSLCGNTIKGSGNYAGKQGVSFGRGKRCPFTFDLIWTSDLSEELAGKPMKLYVRVCPTECVGRGVVAAGGGKWGGLISWVGTSGYPRQLTKHGVIFSTIFYLLLCIYTNRSKLSSFVLLATSSHYYIGTKNPGEKI
jgi:hypothetical protein